MLEIQYPNGFLIIFLTPEHYARIMQISNDKSGTACFVASAPQPAVNPDDLRALAKIGVSADRLSSQAGRA
jgi:hypothetical protein